MKVDNPTSRDIADIAGVSQATVSRALRNSPLVRKETRDRIFEIARELNYFVNRNAAGLRTHQSYTIAALMFDEAEGSEAEINPFFLSMLGHITRSAAQRGYDVLVSIQQQSNDWHVEYQASHRADGLILLGYGDYRSYREKLDALAEAQTRFMIWGPVIKDQPGHSWGCDNADGGFKAGHHLIGLGRKRLAFLGTVSRGSPEFVARHDGFVRAHEDAGLTPDPTLQLTVGNSEKLGYEAVQELIASGAGFDGIFAATDLLAIGAMRAIQDAGMSVPGDVSVVGFDDIPLASHVSPSLTTVRQDLRKAGEGLVDGIVALIEGKVFESVLMPPNLVVRDSCGGQPDSDAADS
jgi:DNA-binding LacI/PurR family transcriptional regulator